MSALPDSSRELARVQSVFEQWRARRSSPRQRIPAELWDAALSLLDHYPLSTVARALRISIQQLRGRRDALLAADTAATSPVRFVEFPAPALTAAVASPTGADAAARFVLERPDGARLSLALPVARWDLVDSLLDRFLAPPR